MWSLFNRAKDRQKKIEVLKASRIEFLYEQLGDSETELKQKLIKIFHGNERVMLAYLVSVRYREESDQIKVALCVKHSTGQDFRLLQEVGAEFGKMFNNQESLDVMFLKREEEERIAIVARPFYRSSAAEAQ